MANITCLKQQKVYQVKVDLELLCAYHLNPALPFKFGCCKGQCGACAIKVVEGNCHLSKITKQEKETLSLKGLDSSYRLACQCCIQNDITLDI
jgi:ferredoxin